ncbi:excalibur calcium-binding domain-containing protein [Sphingomonas alba]|uniref:Excalibur calcium-binding domain-containing protein n=1 Tax=Sphingomonas alba TaxID=2908208 RepID=A0ABT0RN74_9SPHN|nr:excalibur calcium-binding domain-containing protein [Sphingomonas alba]MCL6684092.1 excalibur calcium-binding domain-containing protein [Sphingomonas alba]
MPTFYPSCSWARTFGAAPIHRGEPGYRSRLDADDDGIACEPYAGNQEWRRVQRWH